MGKFVLIIFGIIFLASCSNPQKEAETKARELTTSFSTSLSTITNTETISAFDLRQKMMYVEKNLKINVLQLLENLKISKYVLIFKLFYIQTHYQLFQI